MNRLSRILVPVAAMATIALSIPAMANATDYCVQTSCGGTNVNDLQAALDEAKKSTDADRVFLGAGVQVAQSSFGFKYDGTGSVEIIGAGENNTVLTAPLGATRGADPQGRGRFVDPRPDHQASSVLERRRPLHVQRRAANLRHGRI